MSFSISNGMDPNQESPRKPQKAMFIAAGSAVVFLCLLSIVYYFTLSSPKNFPAEQIFAVKEGDTVSLIGRKLKSEHFIRSEIAYRITAVLLQNNKIVEGSYAFSDKTNVMSLVLKMGRGTYGVEPVKITIPEGTNVPQMAEIVSKSIPAVNKVHFAQLAKSHEGYLFPDTYLFFPNIKSEEIIKIMKENFDTRISSVAAEIEAFKYPLKDVIILASILEEEVRQTETRRVVAGILWKRLEIGMPLQVDASFVYVNGKKTHELTLDDLRIDSPYNTYKYRGLPPTAISNPGIDAITAAIRPIKTPYLYFLTDEKGDIHYASTLEEHAFNKQKYLK